MRSRTCQKLLLPFLAVVGFGVAGCGGRAAREQANPPAGETGGVAAAGAAGVPDTNPSEPEPSVVMVSDNGSEGSVDADATPQCLTGFQGFHAHAAGMSLEFEAFVFKPGDYTGDPVQILWLDVQRDDGERYRAASGSASSLGSISLHVEQIGLRFVGSLEALAPGLDDPTLPPLKVALTFDIAVQAGCP